jgi:hypothetical protein
VLQGRNFLVPCAHLICRFCLGSVLSDEVGKALCMDLLELSLNDILVLPQARCYGNDQGSKL